MLVNLSMLPKNGFTTVAANHLMENPEDYAFSITQTSEGVTRQILVYGTEIEKAMAQRIVEDALVRVHEPVGEGVTWSKDQILRQEIAATVAALDELDAPCGHKDRDVATITLIAAAMMCEKLSDGQKYKGNIVHVILDPNNMLLDLYVTRSLDRGTE